MLQKNLNSSILRAMNRCIRQTEFVVNTCVTAPIYIIDTFVSYVVIEKKILSNLFSQGIISFLYYCYGVPIRYNCCWRTKCNASQCNASHTQYVIFLVIVYTF